MAQAKLKEKIQPISSQEFKNKFFQGMSYAAATVNVITSDGPAGRVGLTVSAMSSVSADTPRPTLLVCINENSAAASSILENGVFCVNVLHDHQSFISDVFAGRYKNEVTDKFSCTKWIAGPTGSPRVADVLAGFDCRIVSTKKVGTHHVIFGEVEDITVAQQGSALIYANRSYSSSQPIIVPKSANFDIQSEPTSFSIGCFHTFAPYFIPGMVKDFMKQGEAPSINLVEGDNRRVKEAVLAGEVEVAIMYDFDLPDEIETTTLAQLSPYVLLAEGHPLSKHETIALQDLEGEPMISVAEEASRNQLEGALRAKGVEPNVIFRATSFEMMRGMVGHGIGFGLALTKPELSLTYDGLAIEARPLETLLPSTTIVLAKRRNTKISQAANQIYNMKHTISEMA